jgi:hypothetical protein
MLREKHKHGEYETEEAENLIDEIYERFFGITGEYNIDLFSGGSFWEDDDV